MAPVTAQPHGASTAPALLAQGIAEADRGEYGALRTLAAAQQHYRAAGDTAGTALCAAALLCTGQVFNDYRHFAADIDALAGLRDGSLAYADPNDRLLAHAGLLAGLLMLAPTDPMGEQCVATILELLAFDLDVNRKLAAARLVLYYTEPREQRETGHRVNALVEPLFDHPQLTPHRLGRWLTFRLIVTRAAKETAQYERVQQLAQALVDRHAEPHVIRGLALADINDALPRRDFAAADTARATLAGITQPADLESLRILSWVDGRIALARGEADAALFNATRSRKYCEDAALPGPMLGVVIALEAQARVLARDFAGARERFLAAAAIVSNLHAEEMHDMVRMVDAWEAALAARPDATALLQAAFAAARARQYYDLFDTSPHFGATLCALALDLGVERDFVLRIIELHAMAPPPQAGRDWPWHVRVDTLGTFAIACNGQPLAFHGKAQRKPLDLLKALIALQGHLIDKRRVADAMWPDAPTDAAAAALNMVISRLRKLLRDPDAVITEDGKVGLDPARVWVDLWAFETTVEALQQALRQGAAPAAIEALGERLLALYRGAFLEHDDLQRWALAARDRSRSRFLRSIADAGRHWAAAGSWARAASLYERGLEVDPTSEDLYRQLMRCHLAQGHPADAARVYQRCRTMLASQLDVQPSPETEALYRTVRGA